MNGSLKEEKRRFQSNSDSFFFTADSVTAVSYVCYRYLALHQLHFQRYFVAALIALSTHNFRFLFLRACTAVLFVGILRPF